MSAGHVDRHDSTFHQVSLHHHLPLRSAGQDYEICIVHEAARPSLEILKGLSLEAIDSRPIAQAYLYRRGCQQAIHIWQEVCDDIIKQGKKCCSLLRYRYAMSSNEGGNSSIMC